MKNIYKKADIKERNKKRLYSIIIVILFISFILEIFIINVLKPDTLLSVEENRELQQKPKISTESLITGNFSEEYNKYISDQFFLRNYWVKLKTNLDLKTGKNEINDVFLGKDNYLLEDFKEESNDLTKEKIETINNFSKQNNKLKVSVMLVPTATKILEDKLPKYATVDNEQDFLNKAKNELDSNISFINVYDVLKENKDNEIYYKTDHHWTSKGAYIAYQEMCRQLGLEPQKEEDFNIEKVTNQFYGSLYSKIGAGIGQADSIDVYLPKKDNQLVVNYVNEGKKVASLYNVDSLEKKDKYEVFTNGNHPLINIRSLGDYNKRLLIIKDSYANSFIPFLTEHYGEIDVVDLRYYMDDLNELIDTDGITDILFLYNVSTFNEDNSLLNIEE